MIKRMLVAVDGSGHSKCALEFACGLANQLGAELSLVHVVEWAPGQQTLVMGMAHTTIAASQEAIDEAGKSVLDAARSLAEQEGVKIVRANVKSGPPAKMILEAAEEDGVDTIVMGSRGLGDLGGLLLGSVSHKVTHLATCTCVTVR